MATRTKRSKSADDELPARLPSAPMAGVTTPLPLSFAAGGPPTSMMEERRDREWEELVSEIGSDGRIKVWHIVDGRAQYAGEMTPDTFSLDALLDVFGGGEKSLVFYQGKTKVDTLRVALDASVAPKSPRTAKPGNAAPAPAGGLGDFTAMLSAMAAQQMSSMQMVQTMMTMSQQSSAQLLSAVTAMLTARPEKDPMDTALKMAEVLKPAAPGSSDAATLFSVFEKGMNLASKFNTGDNEDETLKLAGKGLEIVGEIVRSNVVRRPSGTVAGAPSGRATTPRALPAAPGRTATEGSHGSDGRNGTAGVRHDGANGAGVASIDGPAGGSVVAADDGLAGVGAPHTDENVTPRPWVKAAAPWSHLLLMAVGNFSPATVASMMLDRFDDDALDDLLDDMEADDAAAFATRVQGYFGLEPFNEPVRQWFAALVGEVLARTSDDEETLASESDSATLDVATPKDSTVL